MRDSRLIQLGRPLLLSFTVATTAFLVTPANAAGQTAIEASKARVIEHWTQARMQKALPRDLVIDERGLGYLRRPDGSLVPYGHQVAAKQLSAGSLAPAAKPTSPGGGGGGKKGDGGGGGGGGGSKSDTTPPTISNMDPVANAVIGSSYTFSATVTDDVSGVKSVSFIIRYPNGVNTQTFSATQGANNVWSTNLQGFTDGDWSWSIQAKDNGAKGGNTATSDSVPFSVNTGSANDTVSSAEWTSGGAVQTAAGRIYFEMPNNSGWSGYVCSGTVVTDGTDNRSVILTAAHCVYDDVNKAFARNVLFIPNQAGTSAGGTDLNCGNDPLGCWVPSFGAVDVNWTGTEFPNNIPWDYAYYVVNDSGAHLGTGTSSDSLETAAGSLPVSFLAPYINDGVAGAGSVDFTHALGYSYNQDPNFMYCAEDMTSEGAYNWWLPSCELSGGSSGGPWVQPMDTGTGSGPVISVNSWGYTTSTGMAGPKLSGTSADCVFTEAKGSDFSAFSSAADGEAGVAVNCP